MLIPNRLKPHAILKPKIAKITSNQVVSGPFIGMKYINTSVGSAFIPKILGTYELELAHIIDDLCRKSFDTIIDIGAAEGYYAVGFAIRKPKAKVIAYEVEAKGRELMMRMAELNSVEKRLSIRGMCEASNLFEDLNQGRNCLVIMDIEGSESVFLDPFIFPQLGKSHILVELHDYVISDIGEIISRRFFASHKITEIWARPRTIEDFSLKLESLSWKIPKKYIVRSMSEYRPQGMRWFYLEPNK